VRQEKYLTKKQKEAIEDLFTLDIEMQDVLQKHKIKPRTFCRWLEQPNFFTEYRKRLKLSERQKELVFARCAHSVTASLVNLTQAPKEETARKACMHVISHPDRKSINNTDTLPPPPEDPSSEISPEMASRMLSLLADGK
jgi:hypothetical protein